MDGADVAALPFVPRTVQIVDQGFDELNSGSAPAIPALKKSWPVRRVKVLDDVEAALRDVRKQRLET